MKKLRTTLFVATLISGALLFAQTTDQPATAFQAGVTLGTDVYNTGPGNSPESWTQLGFQPDLAFGKFGVGLDLSFHFQLYPVAQPDQAIAFYQGDWVPSSNGFGDWASLYFSKLLYVRYGLKGQDPLFVKLGSISDFTLGNGFIMGGYSNMSFYPQTRLTGLDFGIDGSMFNFPWVGFEFLTSNLARFDVIGAHVVVRPLVGTDMPILKNLEAGVTAAADTDPGLYSSTTSTLAYTGGSISVYGLDASLPLLDSPAASVGTFTEAALEPQGRAGYMLGAGGKLIGFLTWGTQLRLLGPGFIPTYFDANYDLYRDLKADLMNISPTGSAFAGWLASIGTSVLGDKISASLSLDGPFGSGDGVALMSSWPHFKAVAHLGEGIVPGVFADASYEKYYLGMAGLFLNDLFDPSNAIAGLSINYRTGSSILTLLYNAKWLNQAWTVTSSLQATVNF